MNGESVVHMRRVNNKQTHLIHIYVSRMYYAQKPIDLSTVFSVIPQGFFYELFVVIHCQCINSSIVAKNAEIVAM